MSQEIRPPKEERKKRRKERKEGEKLEGKSMHERVFTGVPGKK